MSSPYPILGDRPIDQWKVTELKDELRRRKLMTKGLKEDLVKRLNEAICNEQESLNKDNDFGSVLQTLFGDGRDEVHVSENSQNTTNISDTISQDKNVHMNPEITYEQESRNLIVSERVISEDAGNSTNISHTYNMERNVDLHPPVNYEQESSNLFISEGGKGGTNPMNERTNHNMLDVDINDSIGSIEKEKVTEGEDVDGSDSAGLEGKHVITVEASELVSEDLEPVTTLSGEDLPSIGYQNKISDVKTELKSGDPIFLHVDAKDDTSEANNQVSEVNPVLGFQVKCESISSETVSIIDKIELKDNIITDDVKLEVDVRPEMVQPSSHSDVPEGGKPHPIDVEEPHANVVPVEETGGGITESVDIVPKSATADLSASGKVNLNRGSGDDFMEEDMTLSKQMDSRTVSDEMNTNRGKDEASAIKDEGGVVIVGKNKASSEKVFDTEDQVTAGNTDVAKRQRRWNSDVLKTSEARAGYVVSTPPKDVFQPAFKRSFSMLDPAISEEDPKALVVPPSAKPPTNSLRIDRFLRPFTLKAVQELLGKTGSVTSFWMDHIKTHCYASYSSVEEAVETRNAVYNLQWPPNGGRLLVAEFVDPQEVKARLEAPPQSPATPVSSGARNGQQPEPPQRPQVPKQQLLQPPPPPPPMLSNPPPVREQLLPPPREQLPPPLREHLPPVKERLTLPPSSHLRRRRSHQLSHWMISLGRPKQLRAFTTCLFLMNRLQQSFRPRGRL